MTPQQIIEWMFVLFVASGLVSVLIALNIFLWVLIRDIWRGK